MTPIGPWEGGTRARNLAAAAGAAGLAVTAIGGVVGDPRRALSAYLVAFVYWLGLALGVLILLASFHASSARWPVVLRRFLENGSASLPVFVVLFLPVLLGRGYLFSWVNPDALVGEARHLVEHRRAYLNAPGFAIRAAVYFACWILVAHLLRAWSVRQDREGGIDLTRSQRRLGGGSLPFLGLTMSFAAFDWMMSLDPHFYSTIFGVYWFAGSFMAAFAVAIVAGAATRDDPTQFGAHMGPDHFQSLGNFLLSFVAFWAYAAFSQLMLIWIANIPDEVPWYVVRIRGGWFWVGAFLAVFKFLVPFFLLLSRPRKRDPRRLARLAWWLLFTQWVDLYWVVMPSLYPDAPRPSLWDVAAFVGVGGVALAFTLARARGVAPLPLRDPYLDESLRYSPP